MNLKRYITVIYRYLLCYVTFLFLSTSCSNNVEEGLYPDSESHISLSVSAPGLQNGLLSIGSAQSSTLFTVTSTTRWTVEVTDCEGAWCQIVYDDNSSSGMGHIGNGFFNLEAVPNRTGNDRECNITVYAIDRYGNRIAGKSVLIHLLQERQSIHIDYTGEIISPYGTTEETEPTVTVTANQAWSVSASEPWITILPGDGMSGNGYAPDEGSSTEETISFKFSVERNPGTSTRTAELIVSSPSSAFTPLRLNVTQEGSSDTFFVTPTNVPVIPYTGSVVEFQVYSPQGSWETKTIISGDWLTLDQTSGNASTELVTLRVTVEENKEASSRQAGIVFTYNEGKSETTVTLTQGGNLEMPDPNYDPTVSKPWIMNGNISTWAQLRAYYLSPVYEIITCGAYIYPADKENEQEAFSGEFGENDMILVDLRNLQPNTEYTTWAYVEYYVDGKIKRTESEKIRFTTPAGNDEPGSNHETPGANDNIPPSVK